MTFYRRIIFLILCAGLAAVPLHAEQRSPAEPTITWEEAVQAAQQFARKAGLPVGDEPWESLDRYTTSPAPTWRVGVGPGVEVRIDASTAAVKGFVDCNVVERSPNTGGPKVTQDQAVSAAQRILDILGILQDVRLDRAEWINPGTDRPAHPGHWWVVWKGFEGGPERPNHGVQVVVHAGSGEVISLARSSDLLSAEPLEVRLTPEQAVQVAADMLRARGYSPEYLWPVELHPSRTTYLITFLCPSGFRNQKTGVVSYERGLYQPHLVIVDVDSGRVVSEAAAKALGTVSDIGEGVKPYLPGRPVPSAITQPLKLLPPRFRLLSWPGIAAGAAILLIAALAFHRLRRRRRRSAGEKDTQALDSEKKEEEAELPQKGDLA